MGGHDLSNTHAVSIEGRFETLLGVCVLYVRTNDSWVDERDDAAENGRRGQGGIRTDRGNIDDKRVKVLFRGHDSLRCGDCIVSGAQFCNDLVGQLQFGTGVCCCKENAGNSAGQREGLTWLATTEYNQSFILSSVQGPWTTHEVTA